MTTEGTTGEAGSKDVAVDACANCGKSGECDDVKLKNCTACYLTKYCSVDCQRAHRSEHKPACKLGAAEIKERPNFKPPKPLELSPEARILRSEVISLKATALPLPTRNREERQAKVGQLRVLYEKVEAYEILLEEERLEAALRAHEEKYPRPTKECPLCLGDIQYTISVHEMLAFNCCSNAICADCSSGMKEKTKNEKCPMCRSHHTEWGSITKQRRPRRKVTTRRGSSWRAPTVPVRTD